MLKINAELMNKNQSLTQKKRSDGFTIIEILIVLVIAGLILLIVLLAVSALQRTSRNTQRKNDASLIAAAINTYKQNFAGAIPNNLMNDNGHLNEIDISMLGDHSRFQAVKLGFYNGNGTPDNVWGASADAIYIDTNGPVTSLKTPGVLAPGSPGTDSNNITDNNISIIAGETCDDNGEVAGILDTNAVAVFYVLEDGHGNGSRHCLQA